VITKKMHVLITALVFCVVFPASFLKAQSPLVGDLGLLSRVADAIDKNYRNLATWSGTAEVSVSQSYGPSDVSYQCVANIEFVSDVQRSRSRWTYTLSKETIRTDKTIPFKSSGMLSDGKTYRLSPFPTEDARPTGLILLVSGEVPNTAKPMQTWHDDFHPRAFFIDTVPETTGGTPQMLRGFKEEATDPKFLGGTISEDGDLIVLELKAGSDVNRYEFSKRFGYNLVKRYMAGPEVDRTETVEYNSYNGVYVPSKFLSVQSNKQSSGAVETFRNETNFSKCLVNAPIAKDEFSVGRLGVRVGDTVSDKVLGLNYTFNAATNGETPPSK
jgi:hypothetical protein